MFQAMKKIFTLSSVILVSFLIFAGCTKRSYIDVDERYWLSQERGEVVYSSSTCDFYLVATYNGYEVIHSWDGYRPFEGTVLYGNFSNYGTRNFYDRANGILVSGEVVDYWLTYSAAEDEINYYCY
jgi:hypothetical protein